MAKYTNVVRFKVKPGKQQEFESLFSKADKWDGHYSIFLRAQVNKTMWVMAYGKVKKKWQTQCH